MDTSKNLYIFSRSNLERHIINYIDKVGFLVLLVALIAEIIFGQPLEQPFRWFTTLLFLLALLYTFGRIFRRFAYKISFNIDKNEFTFSMLRKRGTFVVKQDNITKIHVNFFITFYFEGKKIIFTGVDDEQLIGVLRSQRQISWGPFWNLTCKIRKEH